MVVRLRRIRTLLISNYLKTVFGESREDSPLARGLGDVPPAPKPTAGGHKTSAQFEVVSQLSDGCTGG